MHYSIFSIYISLLACMKYSGHKKKLSVLKQAIISVLSHSHTLSSVTGSDHVNYKRNSLACKIHENMPSGHIKVKKKAVAMYLTRPLPVTLLRVQLLVINGDCIVLFYGAKWPVLGQKVSFCDHCV